MPGCEAIYLDAQDGEVFAGAAGFEYTFFDINSSGIDLGVLSEYLYDDRDFNVTPDEYISLGVRLTFNDINSTDFLTAFVHDPDNRSHYYYVEASRRLGDAFRLSLEARGVGNLDEDDPLQVYDGDNYLQLELSYFF
jgi:hypothetical protein